MKGKKYLLSGLILLCICIAAQARIVKGFTSAKEKSTGYITFKIESIDYRSDLIRVYGKLQGRPHTSERMDELVMILPDGRKYEATDIDGVDMKRWFQWEDSGEIDVEIDFPVIKESRSFVLKANGPKGESATKILRK